MTAPPPATAPEPPMMDLLIAGLGPGGAAAALAARQLGLATWAAEARGPEATRAQLILVRPGARAALARIGFADITEGRRTTTIRHVENRLRAALEDSTPASGSTWVHQWHTSVQALDEHTDHVRVTLRDECNGQLRMLRARHVIDAAGGRLVVPGRAERQRVGRSHWVVTAEYATPPWFDGIVGVRDRHTHELCMLFPTWGRQGVIAYLDAQPGRDDAGEQLAERLTELARNLGLGEPLVPPWAVDVAQRLLPERPRGRVLPIGDAVGTVDVLTGNGMSTAIEDAVATVEALAKLPHESGSLEGSSAIESARTAVHAALYARHRRAMWRGRAVLAVRPILERAWPEARLPQAQRTSVGPPPLLWPAVRLVFGRRPPTAR